MSRPAAAAAPDSPGTPGAPDALGRPARGSLFRIVFVCTGNICRSPMAETVAGTLAGSALLGDRTPLGDLLEVSSAGTGPWHEGEPMDPRTAAALRRAGFQPHAHVAHQFPTARKSGYDMMVALDRRHQQTLRSLGADPARIFLLRSFDPASGAAPDVPDPYYGDDVVFDECLAMIERGCRGLIATLTERWSGGAVPAA